MSRALAWNAPQRIVPADRLTVWLSKRLLCQPRLAAPRSTGKFFGLSGRRLQAALREAGIAIAGSAPCQWWPEARAELFWRTMAGHGTRVRLFNRGAGGMRCGLPPDEAGWQRPETAGNGAAGMEGNRMKDWIKLALAMLCLHGLQAGAAVTAQDDEGNRVTLDKPAQRVVSLAPHVTELLFAAGGARKVVGVVDYSDYPPEAKALPRVGSHRQIDLERLIALKPDLLVVWPFGGAARQLEPLRKLGIPVYVSEPHRIADIGATVRRLGRLLGTDAAAGRAADAFDRRRAAIEARYAGRPPVKVFYQVWDRPLYTLNGSHTASDAIRLCGGENIFASLPVTAPMVTVEAVLKENPEVIVSGNRPGQQEQDNAGLEAWKQYPSLLAAQRGNLFTVDADLLARAGPRILDGIAGLCERLDEARGKRSRQP